MSALAIIQLIAALLPSLIQIITEIEKAVGPGNGQVKLEMTKDILSQTYQGALKFEEVWPKIASTIGAIVKGFNMSGRFQTASSVASTKAK